MNNLVVLMVATTEEKKNISGFCSDFAQSSSLLLKLGYSEKATKFEKIFHLKFDITE